MALAISRNPLIAMILVAVAGCSEGPPLYAVKGRVVYKDTKEPFQVGTSIVFESGAPPYQRASSPINDQGEFELSTENRSGHGVMEGKHRVQISYLSNDGADLRPQLSKLIDPKYFEFRSSGIEVDIKPDAVNDFTIELERPKN
jgi:hypothetical protein